MLKRNELIKLIEKATDLTKKNGGCSINLQGEEPTLGYMVSLNGMEQKLLNGGLNLRNQIEQYIRRNEKTLEMVGAYLGLWKDGNILYIDVSIQWYKLETALAVGKIHRQIAIYDVVNKKEIRLEVK